MAHATSALLASALLIGGLVLPGQAIADATDSIHTAGIEKSFRPSEPVELIIANRPIITMRAEVFGNKPDQRVRNIHRRLDEWFSTNADFTLRDTSLFGGRGILINGSPLLFITALDVDPTEGETLDEVTGRTRERLEVALAEYREVHDAQAMLRNIGWIILYTALFALALWALARLRRGVRDRIERFIHQGMERTGIKGGLSRGSTLLLVGKRLVVVLIGVLMLVALYFWLTAVLGRIQLTRAWSEQMFGVLSRAGLWMMRNILDALPGLAVVAFIVLVARWMARLVASLFDRISSGEVEVTWIDSNIAAPTKRVVIILLWLFAIVISYPYIPGSSTRAFQGISVLAGLMLSLGSSSVVSQAASGMVIMFNRVIRVGESVAIGDKVAGRVKRIGYFNTIITTGYGEELTVPNSEVLGSIITNRTRHGGEGILYTAGISIGYDAPWRQVHAMLIAAAESTPGIAKAPAPLVNQESLDDHYVSYRLTVVIEGAFRPTLTALFATIQDVFNVNGVQIMSPHYEGDPEGPKKMVPKEGWDPGVTKP